MHVCSFIEFCGVLDVHLSPLGKTLTVKDLSFATFCVSRWFIVAMQPIDGELFKLLIPVSICHALGHVMTNVSFAAVAVSFTHTIKG
jgi:hypothetical protein